MFRCAVLLQLILLASTHAFVPASSQQRVASSSLDVFGGSNLGVAEFPRDVKEAVSKCREAVQEALKNKESRMDIEFPVGANFNIEKTKKKQTRASMNDEDGGPSKDQLDTSDRELARIFVEMFQPLGGDHISVVFTDGIMADLAKKRWKGDSTAASRILAMNRRKKAAKKVKKPKGFAAKLNAEFGDNDAPGGPFQLPENTEVALFVAPGPKELVVIEKICNDVGMGTLVVLLNARLSKIDNFGTEEGKRLFLEDFQSIFHLRAAPQEEAPGCLLHRAYPNTWALARKPKVGQPKTILSQEACPTAEECGAAYDSIEIGDVEKGVENVLDGVSSWFR